MLGRPKLSIVIPCRNEAPYIQECLDHILASDNYDILEVQIFVVDGMSDDGTREIVAKNTAIHPAIHLIDNNQKLTPFAFNLGIYAGGAGVDFVQIVGARHMLSPNYLKKAVNILQTNSEIWCVGGQIINEFVNDTGKNIASAMSTAFGMGLGNFRTLQESGFTDTVTSPMYPYSVFEKIGFFDEELIRNQDDDFNFRVTQAGGKIFYEHTISLRYYVRGSLNSLWRQFYQYGYWKVYVNKKHKTVTTMRQLVPPAFVAYLILILFSLLLFGFSGDVVRWPLYMYVLLTVIFSYSTAKNKGVPFTELIKIFPILHVSYGLGYLKGIWHFLLLGKKPTDKQKRMSR